MFRQREPYLHFLSGSRSQLQPGEGEAPSSTAALVLADRNMQCIFFSGAEAHFQLRETDSHLRAFQCVLIVRHPISFTAWCLRPALPATARLIHTTILHTRLQNPDSQIRRTVSDEFSRRCRENYFSSAETILVALWNYPRIMDDARHFCFAVNPSVRKPHEGSSLSVHTIVISSTGE